VLERRTLDGGINALFSNSFESGGFLVAFTERSGGESVGPFRSLNLGLRVGDDLDSASANRSHLCAALGVVSFACGRQVHGTRVGRVDPDRADAGFADPSSAFSETDALVTKHPQLAIAILTADCLPVALADPRQGLVAVVHAGWRGIAGGIIERVLRLFDDPSSVMAAIGPGIGPDHYEVGEDVAAAVSGGAGGGAAVRRDGARLLLDLAATADRALRASGVRTIETSGLCTACEEERFFSYRRDGITGRQALIAMRVP
jgi:purine-nucleoside/S-methyl-5'-thioadenosine phosphorylase / adenosine deaminase